MAPYVCGITATPEGPRPITVLLIETHQTLKIDTEERIGHEREVQSMDSFDDAMVAFSVAEIELCRVALARVDDSK